MMVQAEVVLKTGRELQDPSSSAHVEVVIDLFG